MRTEGDRVLETEEKSVRSKETMRGVRQMLRWPARYRDRGVATVFISQWSLVTWARIVSLD